jgi:hypothetical protein
MCASTGNGGLTRRQLISTVSAAALGAPLLASGQAPAAAPPAPPAAAPETFEFRPLALAARPFPMTQVRLLEGPCKQAQDLNRAYLHRLPVDRLVHNFKVNAGLPSSAQPLGGWEKPDCELRGHFTGHCLSACGLGYSSTGDKELKQKSEEMVAELARCQQALKGGYLSAFPLEFWDRLKARKKVWAPFYTIHKIMAGMLDVYQHTGNKQALEVLQGMAAWADQWSQPIPPEHMQSILMTEFGGMAEVLHNLAAATQDKRWAEVAQRWHHSRFFDPLALRRDELKGLHVNTQVPKVIGAALRYELSRQRRYHDIADFFWYEVTSARCYCTGGTSNNEGWQTDPGRLAEELQKGYNTNECCVAYNMMKLTRRLYQWTADPCYFDYYERTLFNHRLGTLHPETGGSMYYLPLRTGARKVFGADFDAFWCCTGTGVEEYAKLNDSIYFHDGRGLYVNLFIASELDWKEKGVKVRQQTNFPEQEGTALTFTAAKPVQMALCIRIPVWATRGGSAKVNGTPVNAFASPGSYLTIARTWKTGDRLELSLPMSLYSWPMPDDETLQAFMYGPLVLVGAVSDEKLTKEQMYGRGLGPEARRQPVVLPDFRGDGRNLPAWIKASNQPLTFRTTGQERDVTLVPFYRMYDQRYGVYWRVRKT